MRAAVVEAFDRGPRYGEFPDPVAGDGELIGNVSAAGLHPIVRALANGTHYGSTGALPFVPGIDGVGRLDDSKRVYFGISRSPYGSLADKSVTSSAMCVPLPDALGDVTAAAIANPAMSSWVALKFRAAFVAGESVLVLGATGVAGGLAVQIAKRFGARRVVAAGRNTRGLDQLRALGADAVISLGQDHTETVTAFRRQWANGVDVVLDYLWGRPAELLLEAAIQRGLRHAAGRVRYVQIGSSAGQSITLPAAVLRSTGLEMLGSGFGSASIEQILRAVSEMFDEAVRHPFQFEVKALPLAQIEARWDDRDPRLVFLPG